MSLQNFLFENIIPRCLNAPNAEQTKAEMLKMRTWRNAGSKRRMCPPRWSRTVFVPQSFSRTLFMKNTSMPFRFTGRKSLSKTSVRIFPERLWQTGLYIQHSKKQNRFIPPWSGNCWKAMSFMQTKHPCRCFTRTEEKRPHNRECGYIAARWLRINTSCFMTIVRRVQAATP